MNRVSRFLALLLGSSAFISNYPSYAAKKYESKSGRTDSVSDIRRRKKNTRKGKSAALVSDKEGGSKNSKVKSFATKSVTTSRSNDSQFSLPWFLTGGGSGAAVAGLASWGFTKLYDWHKYKKLVGQPNPSGGNNEQFDQLKKDKLALETAIGLISPQQGTSTMSYADFINIVSNNDIAMGIHESVTNVRFEKESNVLKCTVTGMGINDTLAGEYTFTISNPDSPKTMSFTAKAPNDNSNVVTTTLQHANYFGEDVTEETKKKMLLLSLASCMLKKAGFRFSNDYLLMDGILFSVASVLANNEGCNWKNFNLG